MSQRFSFNHIAPVYDKLSYLIFWGSIQRAQRFFLTSIPPQSTVLIIGGGSGDILIELLNYRTPQYITYVEASTAMLNRARQKVANYRRANPTHLIPMINFIQGTEQDVDLPEKHQVVITNFVLDMYQEETLTAMMKRIDDLLAANALWFFTDFRYSSQPLVRYWQRPLAWIMYRFFHLTANISLQSLPNYDFYFQKLGWQEKQSRSFFGDFIATKVYARA